MFVPRQVKRQTPITKTKRCHPAVPVAQPGESDRDQRPVKRRRASWSTTIEAPARAAADGESNVYYEEIRYGLELLLSDYAYSEPGSRKWLLERERQVGGARGFIHLSAFLDSPIFVGSRPPVTQLALQKALEFCKSDFLEEPHLSSLALYPPKLIQHLLSHHQAPDSIIPVQHVQVGKRPSYAFVVLSSPVHNIRAHCWPTDWVVLTKAEWKRRDLEYQALRIAESRPYYSISDSSTLPVAVLPNRTGIQCLLTKRDHPTGHLVYLTNLSPSATKSSITTLINQHVDKYFRGLQKPPNREGALSEDQVARSTPSSNSTSDIVSPNIMYTDYTPGTTTAIIRLASAADADEVITAFATQGVSHNARDCCRSKFGCGDSVQHCNAVKAELVTGERESIYWEKSVWKGKGKRGKKEKKGDGQETSEAAFVYDDYNADVHNGNAQWRLRPTYNGSLKLGTRSTREHIKFED